MEAPSQTQHAAVVILGIANSSTSARAQRIPNRRVDTCCMEMLAKPRARITSSMQRRGWTLLRKGTRVVNGKRSRRRPPLDGSLRGVNPSSAHGSPKGEWF